MVEHSSHVVESPDPRRSGTKWFLDAVFPNDKPTFWDHALTRLIEKWRAATLSPWFALLCAAGSFAALLVFTGVLAGLALTKQPTRIDMMTAPRVEDRMAERNYDDDPIALLIERTSLPDGSGTAPTSSPPSPSAPE